MCQNKAAYKLTVQAAREYAATIDGAFELYLDDELVLKEKYTNCFNGQLD